MVGCSKSLPTELALHISCASLICETEFEQQVNHKHLCVTLAVSDKINMVLL
uniref:Uncharacterized protein n=1 Tax=Anguilla anguilla TaxID=7936 RepID=A0A0E9PVS5_ANGAN